MYKEIKREKIYPNFYVFEICVTTEHIRILLEYMC